MATFSSWNSIKKVQHVDFAATNRTQKKMEKIQERALKFIYEDQNSTYEELLEKSKLPSLKVRRIRTIAIETFKIINKQSPLYLHDLV